jgi:hypothetical protein
MASPAFNLISNESIESTTVDDQNGNKIELEGALGPISESDEPNGGISASLNPVFGENKIVSSRLRASGLQEI